MSDTVGSAGSQTLHRGLRVLETIAEAEVALPLPELCRRLDLHRSIVYRLLRTLEEHGLAVRDASGSVRLGTGVAALARAVERDLQASALPELTVLANELGATAFLTVLDDDAVVTLVSVEPRHGRGAVAQRPGSRHALGVGAPGAAIRSLLDAAGLERAGVQGPRLETTAAGALYAVSHDEVIPGLSSVAVPLAVPEHPPAALAVVRLSGATSDEDVAAALAAAAATVVQDMS